VETADIGKKKAWMGILVVPPLILLIALGPPAVLSLMVLVATFLGLREFYPLAFPHSQWVERSVGIVLGIGLALLLSSGQIALVPPYVVFLLLVLSVLFMATSQNLLSAISNVGVILLGILYVGFLLAHVSLIRNLALGRQWVLFLIATVWAGDISAFLFGSRLGRHKLYPKISPKKTVEGLAGGLLGSAVVAVAFSLLFLPQLKTGPCVLLAFAVGILGQLGDFTESMLKRSAQVKDSGSLIPGHGGILDRLDSFLFTAPFLYYFLLFFFKGSP
jgi:phosphatidate cytidylyltransferase